MSIRKFFTHNCTLIQPGKVIGQDPYGRDIYGTDKQKRVPCRVDGIRTGSKRDEYGTDYVTQNILFLPPEYEITNDSRFKDFLDSWGMPVIAGEYEVGEITPVYKRRKFHHYEVELMEGRVNGQER